MISIDAAFDMLLEAVQPLSTENVPLSECAGRYLANSVLSDVDSPPHDKSVMDGIAVQAADINNGTRQLRVIETIAAGGWPKQKIESGQCSRIMTGAPMPEGADSVVMVELIEFDESESLASIELDQLKPGQHAMQRAATLSKGQVVFEEGHCIRPTDIGLLAETGNSSVWVGGEPTIAVLPTGDELVDCKQIPERGMIRNSNGPMVAAMSRAIGLPTTSLGIGRDDEAKLRDLVNEGLEHDILILTGGVSAGEFDLVPKVLEQSGVKNIFHKVAVKPGKPIWFGTLTRESSTTYVFGLPGNPVSSLVGFQLFVKTAIRKLKGAVQTAPKSYTARLAKSHEARGNRPTYWPGRWVESDSVERIAEPLGWQGSSDLNALGQADLLIHFPVDQENRAKAFAEGSEVQVFPLSE